MIGGRTLEVKGVKHVEVAVQRIQAMTHSYSLQLGITAAGELFEPTLVCFYEPKGAPQKFHDELRPFTNLYCVWSTSGKLTKAIVGRWVNDLLLPKVDDESLVLVDSWGGWKDPLTDESVKRTGVEIHVIPEGATKTVQPLDVCFNRQFKEFHKIISQRIRRRNPDYILSMRANLARLISLELNQFSAPLFRDFRSYAWHKSGYYTERPGAFRTPPQYCLKDPELNGKCHCGHLFLTRCAFCGELLCFDHFIAEKHWCN